MAKAQLAAEIASEKAAQIEKIAEANLHVSNLALVIDLSSSKRLAQPGTGYKITLIKFTGKKKKNWFDLTVEGKFSSEDAIYSLVMFMEIAS